MSHAELGTTKSASPKPGFSRLVMALPLLAFFVLAGFFYIGLQHDPQLLPSAMIDRPVPEFNLPPLLPDMPGLARADLLGQPALVNFFASWCGPCRMEHSTLQDLASSNKIKLYGIVYKDRQEDSRRFLADLGNPFSRLADDAAGRTAIDFGVYGVPETYLVDAQGKIRFRWSGPLSAEVIDKEILPRLAALKN